MAKSPNTDPFNGTFTQWTQPYVAMNGFYIQTKTDLELELERLDRIDVELEGVEEFPEVLELIREIKQKF